MSQVRAPRSYSPSVKTEKPPHWSGVEGARHPGRGMRIRPGRLNGQAGVTRGMEPADAMRAGAVEFIEKPIIDRIVLRRAKSALEAPPAAPH